MTSSDAVAIALAVGSLIVGAIGCYFTYRSYKVIEDKGTVTSTTKLIYAELMLTYLMIRSPTHHDSFLQLPMIGEVSH